MVGIICNSLWVNMLRADADTIDLGNRIGGVGNDGAGRPRPYGNGVIPLDVGIGGGGDNEAGRPRPYGVVADGATVGAGFACPYLYRRFNIDPLIYTHDRRDDTVSRLL